MAAAPRAVCGAARAACMWCRRAAAAAAASLLRGAEGPASLAEGDDLNVLKQFHQCCGMSASMSTQQCSTTMPRICSRTVPPSKPKSHLPPPECPQSWFPAHRMSAAPPEAGCHAGRRKAVERGGRQGRLWVPRQSGWYSCLGRQGAVSVQRTVQVGEQTPCSPSQPHLREAVDDALGEGQRAGAGAAPPRLGQVCVGGEEEMHFELQHKRLSSGAAACHAHARYIVAAAARRAAHPCPTT